MGSHLILGFQLENKHLNLVYNKRGKIPELVERSLHNLLPSIFPEVIKKLILNYIFEPKKKQRGNYTITEVNYDCINDYYIYCKLKDETAPFLNKYFQIQLSLACPHPYCMPYDNQIYFNFLNNYQSYSIDEIQAVVATIKKKQPYLTDLWNVLELKETEIKLYSLPNIY